MFNSLEYPALRHPDYDEAGVHLCRLLRASIVGDEFDKLTDDQQNEIVCDLLFFSPMTVTEYALKYRGRLATIEAGQ
jgi:hypothetical protein